MTPNHPETLFKETGSATHRACSSPETHREHSLFSPFARLHYHEILFGLLSTYNDNRHRHHTATITVSDRWIIQKKKNAKSYRIKGKKNKIHSLFDSVTKKKKLQRVTTTTTKTTISTSKATTTNTIFTTTIL